MQQLSGGTANGVADDDVVHGLGLSDGSSKLQAPINSTGSVITGG
jgi:hypothetical protein